MSRALALFRGASASLRIGAAARQAASNRGGLFFWKRSSLEAQHPNFDAQYNYAGKVLQTSVPSAIEKTGVTSLCSSVPVHRPPEFVGDIIAKACIGDKSEIQFYSSRSCEGTAGLQREIKKYYHAKGLKTPNQKAIFTNSEHNIILMLIDFLKHETGSVIMTTPTFGLFFNSFFNREIDVNLVKLSKKDDWKLTPKTLSQALQKDEYARVFVFINPDNPSGKSYSKSELEALAKEFISHNQERKKQGKPPLILFCDEASRRIMLNPKEEFCSIATIAGMEEFTLTVSTSSKDLAPGLAICHGFGASWIIDKLLTQERTTLPDVLASDRFGPSYPSQVLLEEIFSGRYQAQFDAHLEESIKVYRRNLDIISQSLQNLNSTLKTKFGESPNGEYIEISTMPDGGLQCLIQACAIRGMSFAGGFESQESSEEGAEKTVIKNSFDLVRYIEKVAKVRLLHGELCGFEGEEMFFRVTISKDNERMKEVFDRISSALEQLTPSNENEVDNVVKKASATKVQISANAQKGLS